MLPQLRHGMIVRGQRLRQDIARARAEQRWLRDEYRLARAERPRCVARLADLVARFNGVTLYPNSIERAGHSHSLAGVRATVVDQPAAPGHTRMVTVLITGPGWQWSVPTAALTARRAHRFAALVNSHASADTATAARPATSTGQFRALRQLHTSGILTEEEFTTALRRLAHTT
ncbi:SHOCT domain-containing protein [Pseudonocardia acaciae]|uniref:SHOCT domain-containing protein n=1 Tax=Pseudonocardia acaciae TaxID=551276 RepID=UPI000564FB51|nr:SHOCT domain-containing protein [Pseudonocardia acaciae]